MGGVEPQSETVWRQADKYNVPRIAFVNKMDRVGGDFYNVLEMMKERLGANPLPIVIPIGSGEMFTGIVDLLTMKAILYNESTLGARFEYGDIPNDMLEEAEKWRHHLIEETATYDEHLMEKYLADEEISVDNIKVFIDASATMYILGSKIDYIDNGVESGFVFSNPNEKERCGCGESFSV